MLRLLLLVSVILILQACGGGSGGGDDDELRARGFVAVDFDQDGDIDIASLASNIDTDRGDHQLNLLFNDNTSPGKFARKRRIPVPGAIVGGAFSIGAGDLNQDGHVDIAIQNGRSLFLLLQIAAQPGSFGSLARIDSAIRTYAIAIADLNHDGLDDIALFGESASLSILFQDSFSPGSFLARVDTGISADRLALGDLDGDLIDDLAIIDGNRVKILRQDPGAPGNFQLLLQLDAGDAPEDILVEDLDQDGRLDIVVENNQTAGLDHGGRVFVFLQDAVNPGSFPARDSYGALCLPGGLTVADLNHDGLPDLAVAVLEKFCGEDDIDDSEKTLLLFTQDPANPGHFSAPGRLPNNDKTVGVMRAADYNADGFNDLLVSGTGRIEVLRQRQSAPGHFAARRLVYDPDR